MKKRKLGTLEVSGMAFGCMNASGNGHQDWLRRFGRRGTQREVVMKAAVLRTPGGLDRIEVHDIPDPGHPGPGQIRIALHASSLNSKDLLVANGGLPTADRRILMSDGAGVGEAVGGAVAEFRPGDHV